MSEPLKPRETELVQEIATRACVILNVPPDEFRLAVAGMVVIIGIVHRDVIPLDLDKMLAAPHLDLLHDLVGIRHHLDIDAKVMRDGFVPRCARVDNTG